MYSPQQVNALQQSYPVGTELELYPSSPMNNYEPEARGTVVAHNTQGIIVAVVVIETGQNHSRALKPGHDRFKVLQEHGISLTEAMASR